MLQSQPMLMVVRSLTRWYVTFASLLLAVPANGQALRAQDNRIPYVWHIPEPFKSHPLDYCLSAFDGSGHNFIAGGLREPGSPPPLAFFRTTDAGRTWTQSELHVAQWLNTNAI